MEGHAIDCMCAECVQKEVQDLSVELGAFTLACIGVAWVANFCSYLVKNKTAKGYIAYLFELFF